MARTTRDRLLAAADRIYAAQGFAGTTTRQVAAEAGVNEVTLFRQFVTKERLIEEVIRHRLEASPVPSLGDHNAVPPREALAEWCGAHIARLRLARGVMRHFLAEPDLITGLDAPTCAGLNKASAELEQFLRRIGVVTSEVTQSAVAMLVSTLLVDALAREDYLGTFVLEPDVAGLAYADRFLTMVGVVSAG